MDRILYILSTTEGSKEKLLPTQKRTLMYWHG